MPKLRSVAQNEWKKHPYIFFFTFRSKINEFEEKKLEKRKNSKNLKVAGNHPNIEFTLVFQVLYMKNQNIQL